MRKHKTIKQKLEFYRATCPRCPNQRESIFARVRDEVGDDLVCRIHSGHPLHQTVAA